MIFTFLTAIVFIAEIIIAITIVLNLIRLNKAVVDLDETITLLKPGIKDVCILIRKISEQCIEFAKKSVMKLQGDTEEIVIKQVAKFILGILFLNKIKKTKLGKTLAKSLSIFQIMV